MLVLSQKLSNIHFNYKQRKTNKHGRQFTEKDDGWIWFIFLSQSISTNSAVTGGRSNFMGTIFKVIIYK